MESMFKNCNSLETLPYIFRWDINNVKWMMSMFENCWSLKYFPDISEWNFNKNCDRKDMLKGVDEEIIPKFKDCIIY